MKMTKFEKRFIVRPGHTARVVDSLKKLLPYMEFSEGRKLLEVGCADGAASRFFAAEHHLDVTGIDVDPELIRIARESSVGVPSLRFMVVDAASLPFQDNRFDIVLSSMVMHHVSRWATAMKEIRRVLKPGGNFIFIDLLTSRCLAGVARLFCRNYGVITKSALKACLEEGGLSTLHSSTAGLLIYYHKAVYQRNV